MSLVRALCFHMPSRCAGGCEEVLGVQQEVRHSGDITLGVFPALRIREESDRSLVPSCQLCPVLFFKTRGSRFSAFIFRVTITNNDFIIHYVFSRGAKVDARPGRGGYAVSDASAHTTCRVKLDARRIFLAPLQ